ncbi:SLAM family member 5-like isoform X2 [Alosa sapidissima]|uniref:SLAM family member 5-like isoform X2 n=1 Tax=Alosa sapidissima TaxID=34773 RepID=UPI001C089DB0|nr:SLAM family member 5-like isoform X2 [Alosa sapidissima]XP_041945856.1 SLAM family member 5-like isoform X2 [Alosa sapidissima]
MGPFLIITNFLTGLWWLNHFFYVLCDTKDTMQNITVRRGENCTLPTGIDRRSNIMILWSFTTFDKESSFAMAQLYKDEVEITPTELFGKRLHLDRQTGSLTIKDITFTDSGVYQLLIRQIGLQESHETFYIFVYGDVGKPKATVLQHYHSRRKLNTSCSVECTVENGREVTLSWYRGNYMLNQTSSPDLNMTLRIPLEVEHHDDSIYSCVAANPVSNKTIFLNISATCSAPPDSVRSKRSHSLLIGLLLILILISFCVVLPFCFKRKLEAENPSEEEPQYIDVNHTTTKFRAKEAQCEDILYSEVKKMAANTEESR